jgi:hypothetical protein
MAAKDSLVAIAWSITDTNLALIDAECEVISEREYGSRCSRQRFINELIARHLPSKERKAYEERLLAEGKEIPEIRSRTRRKKPPAAAKSVVRQKRKANGSAAMVH